jgi:hypothetical protein
MALKVGKVKIDGPKVGGAIGQLGKAIASPQGRALIGTVVGGPALGAAGYVSSPQGQQNISKATEKARTHIEDRLERGFEKARTTLKDLGKQPAPPGEGERQQAQTLAEAVSGKYSDVAQQGLAQAQQMQAPTVGIGRQVLMPGQEAFAAPTVEAAQIAPSQAAQAAQVAAAPTVAGGLQQYLAGLTPEQIQAAQIERTVAPGAAQLQVSEEGRTFQQALAQQLMGQATGTAPSLAEQQLRQAQDRALKQQMAQAASVRGGPSAAAQQRQLGAQLAETQQAQLAEATQARIKEQQAAQETLANVAQGLRTTDVDIAKTAAGLQQQAALEGRKISSEEAMQQATLTQQAKLANQDAINKLNAQKAELTLRAQQGDQQAITELNKVQAQLDTEVNIDNARRVDDMAKQAAQLEMQARMGNQQAALDLQKLQLTMQADLEKFNISQENEMAKFDIETQTKYKAMQNDLTKYYTELGYNAEQAKVKTMMDIAGQKIEQQKVGMAGMGQMMTGAAGIGTAIAGLATAFSDVNVKTNIKTTSMLRDLAGAKPYEYDYKSTEYGAPGKHQSLMAQDIEKIPFLQKIVIDTPKGKVVDYGKALPSMLAIQAEMAKEILELKKKRSK